MKKNLGFILSFFCIFCLSSVLRADELPILSVDDTEAILNHMGREVIVEGTVTSAFWVRNQVMLITFREQEEGFLAVAFARNREKLNGAFSGDMAKAVEGRTVRIRGKISEYRSRPQIVVEEPAQLSFQDREKDETKME